MDYNPRKAECAPVKPEEGNLNIAILDAYSTPVTLPTAPPPHTDT